MRLGRQYIIKHTTNTVRGHVSNTSFRIDPNTLSREDAKELNLNEIGRCSVHFYQPIFGDDHQKNRRTGNFILIDPITHHTVGAGMLIDRGTDVVVGEKTEEPKSQNITRTAGRIDGSRRQELLGHGPATVWLTGLSGSGKSTIAYALEERLVAEGYNGFVLDGDNVRHGLNRDLGFSPEDREENIRRIAEVARLMNDAGAIVLSAFISPYRRDRQAARDIIGERFIEVFVDTPLEVCESRDPRGLYKKAREGEIKNFTGVSAPYEPPEAAEIVVPTADITVEEAVTRIMHDLRDRGIIS